MSYKEYIVKVHENGSKHWYQNGVRHREDGPAVEHFDGTKEWWLSGKLHREDGPVIEYSDGSEYWNFSGKGLTEQEILEKMNASNSSEKVVEIDGKKYKLVEI